MPTSTQPTPQQLARAMDLLGFMMRYDQGQGDPAAASQQRGLRGFMDNFDPRRGILLDRNGLPMPPIANQF